MGEVKVPEGGVVRDDGCVCPPPEEKKKKCDSDGLSTCPYDPRFPNMKQTNRCFLSFVDYQRCARLLGNYPGCNYFLRCYRALCPNSWQERWFEEMEKGTFAYKIYPPKPIIKPGGQDVCPEDYEEDPLSETDIC